MVAIVGLCRHSASEEIPIIAVFNQLSGESFTFLKGVVPGIT